MTLRDGKARASRSRRRKHVQNILREDLFGRPREFGARPPAIFRHHLAFKLGPRPAGHGMIAGSHQKEPLVGHYTLAADEFENELALRDFRSDTGDTQAGLLP
ncbi:hypothetical protein GGQ85_002848 [Nitrobacter vulgaris]|nr:hypothetical protein [Nitrobacter vulgaris]